MEPQQSSSTSSRGPSRLLVLLLILVAVLAIVLIMFFGRGLKKSPEAEITLPQMVEMELEFTVVPDAPETISLPPPPDSDAADLAYYQSVQGDITNEMRADAAFDTIEQVRFGEYLYEEWFYGGIIPNPQVLMQMEEEIIALAMREHERHNRPTPADRWPMSEDGVDTIELLMPRPALDSVYPNLRAVGGFFAAELISLVDPDNAVAHRAAGSEFAERGILYGLYTKSDLDASHSLVEQYFAGLERRSDYADFVTSLAPVEPEPFDEAEWEAMLLELENSEFIYEEDEDVSESSLEIEEEFAS